VIATKIDVGLIDCRFARGFVNVCMRQTLLCLVNMRSL
jgi:hypothetical protein